MFHDKALSTTEPGEIGGTDQTSCPDLPNSTYNCLPEELENLQTLISAPARGSGATDKASLGKPLTPSHQTPRAPETLEEVADPQIGSGPQSGSGSLSVPQSLPAAKGETATAANAAQTLAAALNSGQHNEAITDPRLNVRLLSVQSSFSSSVLPSSQMYHPCQKSALAQYLISSLAIICRIELYRANDRCQS